jgi:putative cell wall-binding protein
MPATTTAAVNKLRPHGTLLKPAGESTRNDPPFFVFGDVASPYQGKGSRTGETSGATQSWSVESYQKVASRVKPKRVVVAPEDDSAISVPAAAWAARSGDPILYTAKDKLPKATISALKEFPAVAYVLGPPSAISPTVVDELHKVATGVKRISGKTPAENAVAFARYSNAKFGWGAKGPHQSFVIARSDEPLEAALTSPLSASGKGAPLLLTESADALPEAVRHYLNGLKPLGRVWIVGDEESIGPSQQAEIERLTEASR